MRWEMWTIWSEKIFLNPGSAAAIEVMYSLMIADKL